MAWPQLYMEGVMSSPPKRAVVIGAGLGGLGVALRLAAQGWQVDIHEQAATAGGKMNRWTAEGYRFDTGPSLITMPWVFEELFAAAGSSLSNHLTLHRVEPIASYHYDDGTHFVHTGCLPDWLPTVRKLEGGDASGFLAFMALGAKLFNVSQATFFKRSPFEPPDRDSGRALRDMPLRRGWGNYARTLQHYIRSPHLRQLFNRYMTYVGSSPYQAPATLAVIPFVEYAFGGWHVQGGLYRIVEALLALGEERGVRCHLNSAVTGITRKQQRITGVQLVNGEVVQADAVIMNGDASWTDTLLGRPGAQPLPEAKRSLSGLIFLFGLKSTRPDQPHHQVFFSADYQTEFRQLFDERRFPDDPTVYINMPSRSDRSMVPETGEVMFVMANAPANEQDAWDGAMIAEARARVFNRLSRSGFPDIRADVAVSNVWTPKNIAQRYAMPGGAIYGQVSHGWRGAFLRPANRSKRWPGLYYVGGSTHPGGGTPTVLMSADITARLVVQHES